MANNGKNDRQNLDQWSGIFNTTTHDGTICKRNDSEGTILVLRQADDFPIDTTDQAIAERITKQIGGRVKFQHEENLLMIFLGLVGNHSGADIRQFNKSILMSSKKCINHMLKTCGWHEESLDCPKPCKDCETEGHPVSADCLTQVHKEEGFKEAL